MVVLDVQKVEFKPPQVGEDYIIIESSMEEAKGDFGTANVIKVALEPLERKKDDSNIYNEGLWYSPNYTPTSKQGAFLTAFEEYFKANPDMKIQGGKANFKNLSHWNGGIIRVLSWEDKNRKIQVRSYAEPEIVKALQVELTKRREKAEKKE